MARALTSSIALVALAAVVVSGAGCRPPKGTAVSSSSEATSSVEATSSLGATTSPEPTVVPEPLQDTQADALEAELKAIESELESMDLPSDSDFKDIEGALP